MNNKNKVTCKKFYKLKTFLIENIAGCGTVAELWHAHNKNRDLIREYDFDDTVRQEER